MTPEPFIPTSHSSLAESRSIGLDVLFHDFLFREICPWQAPEREEKLVKDDSCLWHCWARDALARRERQKESKRWASEAYRSKSPPLPLSRSTLHPAPCIRIFTATELALAVT